MKWKKQIKRNTWLSWYLLGLYLNKPVNVPHIFRKLENVRWHFRYFNLKKPLMEKPNSSDMYWDFSDNQNYFY